MTQSPSEHTTFLGLPRSPGKVKSYHTDPQVSRPLELNAEHWLWSHIAGARQADLCVSFGHLDSKKAMSFNPRILEPSAPFSEEKLVLEVAQKYCLTHSSDDRTPQLEKGNTIGSGEVK